MPCTSSKVVPDTFPLRATWKLVRRRVQSLRRARSHCARNIRIHPQKGTEEHRTIEAKPHRAAARTSASYCALLWMHRRFGRRANRNQDQIDHGSHQITRMRRDPIQSSVQSVSSVVQNRPQATDLRRQERSGFGRKTPPSDARRTVFGRKMPRDFIAPSCAVYSSSGAK